MPWLFVKFRVSCKWAADRADPAHAASHKTMEAVEETRWKMLAANSSALVLTGLEQALQSFPGS